MKLKEIENSKNDKDIGLIEQNLKILNLTSAIDIFAVLLINGKMIYEQLKEILPYSKSTIFRSLDQLLESKLVKREEDNKIKDRRKNTSYYVLKPNIEFPLLDKRLIEVLKENKKEYLIQKMIDSDNILANAVNRTLLNQGRGKKGIVLSHFYLGEKEDLKELEEKIHDISILINKSNMEIERDFKKPLRNPTMFEFNFLEIINSRIESD